MQDLNSPNVGESSSTSDDRSLDKKLWIAVSEVALHVEEFGRNVGAMIGELKLKNPSAGTPMERYFVELKEVCDDIGLELGECVMGQVEKVDSDAEPPLDTETTDRRKKLFKSVEKLFHVTGAIRKTYVMTDYGNLINAASAVKNAENSSEAAQIAWGALKETWPWTTNLAFVNGGSEATELGLSYPVDVSQKSETKDETTAMPASLLEHRVEETSKIFDGRVSDGSNMLFESGKDSLYREEIVPPSLAVDSELSKEPKWGPATVRHSNQGDLGKVPPTVPIQGESSDDEETASSATASIPIEQLKEDDETAKPWNREGDLEKASLTFPLHDESGASPDQRRDPGNDEKIAPPAQAANLLRDEWKGETATTMLSDKESEVDELSETSPVHGEANHSSSFEEKRNPEDGEKTAYSYAQASISPKELQEVVATTKPSNNGALPEQGEVRDNAEEEQIESTSYVGMAMGFLWNKISVIGNLIP